jgi:hypothetical protein
VIEYLFLSDGENEDSKRRNQHSGIYFPVLSILFLVVVIDFLTILQIKMYSIVLESMDFKSNTDTSKFNLCYLYIDELGKLYYIILNFQSIMWIL